MVYNFFILKLIAVSITFMEKMKNIRLNFIMSQSIALSVSKLHDTTLMPK